MTCFKGNGNLTRAYVVLEWDQKEYISDPEIATWLALALDADAKDIAVTVYDSKEAILESKEIHCFICGRTSPTELYEMHLKGRRQFLCAACSSKAAVCSFCDRPAHYIGLGDETLCSDHRN